MPDPPTSNLPEVFSNGLAAAVARQPIFLKKSGVFCFRFTLSINEELVAKRGAPMVEKEKRNMPPTSSYSSLL